MLQKWKLIINNWINCYSDDTTEGVRNVNNDSLLTIISHLRENLNLDESKSSVLEALTVEEFILEKYPGFKFKNGTVKASNGDDIYLGASLLLFFVCVNSKNVDIKSVMCNKLSGDDQEIIMKFSKALMECSLITCDDIQTAITEACGIDMATIDIGQAKVAVAETPPALRSLHGEVRRLQAALDAECFDRNFLQEELTRTNFRLEKLVKDKEQYKLEIMDLKAKISLCCRGDHDSEQMENDEKHSTKLARQLQDMEERLVKVQDQLEETVYENDSLKSKLEGLKEDRDKWLALSQQESARAAQLAEELETERRQMQSLRELVSELRQHNRLNRFDSSLLECDDPDASIQSLGHNLSICSEACVNVIEVQLSEERAKVDALKLQIETLQKENEQLHFAIEEDNSNHELILKEKDGIIDNLEQQLREQKTLLESLRKDHEDITLSWEKHKLKTREIIEVKDERIRKLNDHLGSLKQEFTDLKNVNDELTNKIDVIQNEAADSERTYKEEIESVVQLLTQEKTKNDIITNEMQMLQNRLSEQTSAIDILTTDKNKLEEAYEVVLAKNTEISDDKMILAHQLAEEKSLRQILEEEKKALSTQNAVNEKKYSKQIKQIEKKLSKEVGKTKAIIQDKECLAQQLIEQKSAKELADKEKENILLEKSVVVENLNKLNIELSEQINQLINKQTSLEQQCSAEKAIAEVLNEEKKLLIKTLEEEKLSNEVLLKDKECLVMENNSLKHDILEQKTAQEVLLNDMQLLMVQKEDFVKSLEFEKSVRDEIENEKNGLRKELKEVEEQYTCELKSKEVELENVAEDIKRLHIKLEELSKQNETYTNTLDSQLKEIKTLQQENQNLTNELNTLKIQLEVKVHSLKEKLVEQENATDDLKKGYECQIDNLNIMITNLNKYLKDKTLALELTVNEKNQLKQIVAENDKVINCLKKELETMTQNLERVTSEFESEKLVLENMATVTESVMEDQKVAFNETIAELSNAQKLLQDENATIKDRLENERREFELKIQEKETALELKHQELIELQHSKEDVEEGKILQQKTSDKEITVLKNDILKKENEMVKLKEELHEMNEIKSQKSVLEEEIIVIKADIKSKEEELEKTVQEKNTLENVIRNYEEDVVSLQKQNIDLKIKIDAFEREYHNKVDTLTDSLKEEVAYKKDLNAKLSEKVETILVMENKIKYLEDELNTLKQEKSEVEDSYLAKIGELQTTLQMNSLTNDEEIKKIKEYSMELEQQSFELNRDKTALKENINTLNKNNMDLEENIGQERRIKEELEQYICELRKSIANLQENISVLNDANTELKNEKDKLEQYILKLEKSIAVLKEDVTDLINANTELEQDRLKLKLHGTELKESANNLKLFNTELVEEFNKLKKAHDELSDRFSKEKTAKEEHNKQISNTLCMGLTKLIQDLKKEGIANETLQQLFDVEKDDISVIDKCDMLINIANMVTAEVVMRKNLEKALEHEDAALAELKQVVQQKEVQIFELQSEIKRLKQVVNETKIEMSKQNAMHTTTLDNKSREMQLLQQENTSLTNDLTDVKIQLEVKVHSLKEKLIDSENLTDKLKKSYDCQIENLNIMITKLTNYLKDKTLELEVARKEKERLQQITEVNNKAIKSLEEEVKSEKLRQEKLMTDFESERMVIKNMVTVTESVMEDQKTTFNTTVLEKEKAIELLQEEISNQKRAFELKLKEKDTAIELVQKELVEMRLVKGSLEAEITLQKETLDSEMNLLKIDIQKKEGEVTKLNEQNKQLEIMNKNYKDSAESLADQNSELKIMKDAMEVELRDKVEQLTESLQEQIDNKKDLNIELNEKSTTVLELEEKIKRFEEKINILELDKSNLTIEKDDHLVKMKEFETNSLKDAEEISKLLKDNADLSEENDELKKVCKETKEEINVLKKVIAELKEELDKLQQSNAQLLDDIHELNTENLKSAEEVSKLKISNTELVDAIEGNKAEIKKLEEAIKHEQDQYKKLQDDLNNEKVTLVNKCDILQDYHTKAEKELEERQKEIVFLQKEVQTLQAKVEMCVTESVAKDGHISKMSKEKDVVINIVNQELLQEKVLRAKYQKDLEEKIATISELKKNFNELNNEREALKILKKENEELIKAIGLRETFALRSHESTSSRKYSGPIAEKELRDIHHQVDNTSDITHSSIESLKTITDLEKIIHDKNRTITTLQSDVSYLKTLMAESENKLLDVTKELEVTKENCHQLSSQLKKIVHQKNEDIAELKKHVSKMSVTENRATQIIKVSAKYQAIILKRIAEIKSNTVLKELTNFGNSNNNCDSELRRSLSAGSITMEDLENFLETTERHLKKCSEKQMALQKEKDRLTEVNRINESEIINLKKFLTELSVSFQTFSSVKDLYAQKLSRVISMQRTVRREILNLDGHVTDTCMLKLERGYAAVMQDLAECAMNLERWVERCIGRTVSTEKLKQAFLNDSERTSLAPSTVQNAGLEVQLDELENSFQKLLEEVSRAPKGEGARDAQAVTLMEVRAEYEDKLNRMKAKMKQLYTEQIAVFKEKQKEEIALLERELARARDTLSQSSRAYEDHIRGLTSELWSVGEKFLMQKDEAKFLRRKQQSGSLMSLQHVHSSGLVPPQEEPRHSVDTQSLRSLPTSNNGGTKREGRGLHISDEEGEVFDNRYLQELSTPGRAGLRPGAPAPPERLSELRWRNSLCPPHLKSSYPAETQFAHAVDEEEIKATGGPGAGRPQRKEVGIIAYKKPGPPTPSKQAGRLSATDSELRESLRVEADPQPSRKTSTPSRIRSLFRSSKADNTEGTPRSRRLSNIFRKK